jgi:hypothetical protein
VTSHGGPATGACASTTNGSRPTPVPTPRSISRRTSCSASQICAATCFRDGLIAEIIDLRVDVDIDIDIDDDMIHNRFDATIEDDDGRTTSVTGKTFAHTEFPAAPTSSIIVCSDTVKIEGRPGVGQLDLLWSKDYLDLLRERGLPQLPGKRA